MTGPDLLFEPGSTQQRRCQGRLLGGRKEEGGGRVDEKQVTCVFPMQVCIVHSRDVQENVTLLYIQSSL